MQLNELIECATRALDGDAGAKEVLRGMLQQMLDSQHPESLLIHANLHLELRGPDGEIKDSRDYHNLICTNGKNLLLASGVSKKYVNDFGYICIGTGTTAANAADTALQTETARALGTISNPSANTWQTTVTFAAGVGTGAITESALDYQNTASGNILAHQVFAAINKAAGDSLTMTWQIS